MRTRLRLIWSGPVPRHGVGHTHRSRMFASARENVTCTWGALHEDIFSVGLFVARHTTMCRRPLAGQKVSSGSTVSSRAYRNYRTTAALLRRLRRPWLLSRKFHPGRRGRILEEAKCYRGMSARVKELLFKEHQMVETSEALCKLRHAL